MLPPTSRGILLFPMSDDDKSNRRPDFAERRLSFGVLKNSQKLSC